MGIKLQDWASIIFHFIILFFLKPFYWVFGVGFFKQMLRLRRRQLNPRSQSCPPHPASSKVHRRSLRREISQEIDLAKTLQGIFQVIIRIYRNPRKYTNTFRTIGSVSARVSRMEGSVFFISLKTKTWYLVITIHHQVWRATPELLMSDWRNISRGKALISTPSEIL